MAKQVQQRRGTTAQHNTFTGAAGELTVDTDKNTVVVGDGTTAGGHPLAKASDIPDVSGFATSGDIANMVETDVAPTFTATIQTTERTITGSAFDLSAGNHWTCGAITVPNPTNAVAGTSGLIRITAGPVTWPGYFKFPGGSAPTLAAFPAVVPFYVESSSCILLGNVIEGIA